MPSALGVLIMFLVTKIDLSSRTVFLAVWLACILATCTLAMAIAYTSFEAYLPLIAIQHKSVILNVTFLTTLVISVPAFLFFLSLIRHINSLRTQLGYKVRHDALTGLLAREAFLNDFEEEHSEKENERPDAILVIDADHFKKINDEHGHLAGDKALVAITDAVRKGVRETDRIGRLGGEEFCVYLTNVNMSLARNIAERVRRQVRQASNELGIPGIELSVSIGLVSYSSRQLSCTRILAMADTLLYRAKDGGRDRVEALMVGERHEGRLSPLPIT